MDNAVLRLVQPSEFEQSDFTVSFDEDKPLSMFSDNTWDFAPYVMNRNCNRADKEITFSLKLNDDYNITDPAYEKLLTSVKGFLYARMTRPHPRTGKTVKPRTLVGIWFRLRPLLFWMIENNINSFEKLTWKHSSQYREHVQSLNLAANSVLKKLSVLEMLYLYADYYPNGIKEHPWPDETSVSISGDRKISGLGNNQTLTMPQEVFSQLGAAALTILEKQGADIVRAHEKCCSKLRWHRPLAINRLEAGISKPVGREFEFQVENCSTTSNFNVLNGIANESGYKSYGVLNDSVQQLHTACYIICALFSGMRDSELASMELGAFFTKTGLDGLSTSWIKGTTYKLEEMSAKTEWMVPICVGLAVSTLEQITQFNRESMHRQIKRLKQNPEEISHSRLHELESSKNSLFLVKGNRGYTYRAIDNMTSNIRLRQFVKSHNILGDDGSVWPIATHQFRRTFAVFVAKNIMGDLRYLRHHFKHWSMDMTLHYARHEQGDDSLISEVMTERDKLNRIIVSDWLTGETPLEGGRGKSITAFKNRNHIKTAKNSEEAINNLADGLFLRATGHSWCLSNADTCGGQGLYDSLQCVSCENSVIDKSVLPAWEGIRDQQKEILLLDDVGVSVKYLANQHVEKANNIIRNLSDEH
jgi:hypothetical protein